MHKTTTKFLIPTVSLLCLFTLGVCAPEADPVEDTEKVEITNIPLTVGTKNDAAFKIYVQLSANMDSSKPHTAEGAIKIADGKIGDDKTAVRITELTDPDKKPWKGSNFFFACVVISPETVKNIDDIKFYAGTASSSKTLVLDLGKLTMGDQIVKEDKNLLYNTIIRNDPDIGGDKEEANAPVEGTEKDTEEVKIANIPLKIPGTTNDTFKIYVQLSANVDSSKPHTAEGAIKIADGKIGDDKTAVLITTLTDPDKKPWKGSNFSNACVVISPETVKDIRDIKFYAGLASPSETLVLDLNKLNFGGFISQTDKNKLYNEIIRPDSDIKGDKDEAK
jgi:hypothetical protein